MVDTVFKRIGDVVATTLAVTEDRLQTQINNLIAVSGVGFIYSEISENVNAVKFNAYIVATTTAPITITLPASPSIGDQVKIIDGYSNAATNNITVARNGSNIMGLAENMTIATNNVNITMVYINATRGWITG